MIDFLLDPLTGDLDLTNGLQTTTDTGVLARQRIEQALNINLTEWFLDINTGIPYIRNPNESVAENIRYFLGDKFPDTPNYISSSLDTYLRELPFVSTLESSHTFDPKTREFTYSFTVKLDDGTEVNFPNFIQTI